MNKGAECPPAAASPSPNAVQPPWNATVLVTAYNRSAFLERALESACLQEYEPSRYEILLVSNVPEHGETLEGLKKRYPQHRLRFLRVGDMGIGEMLAVGISTSEGKVVCLLNDDDEWTPKKLPRVVSAFQSHPGLVYVWNGVQRISAMGDRLQTRGRFAASGRSSKGDELVEATHPSELVRVLRWRALGFNDSAISVLRELVMPVLPELRAIRTNEDSFLLHAAAVSGRQLLFIREPLTLYRVHGGGMSQASGTGTIQSWAKLVQNDRWDLASWEIIRTMAQGNPALLSLVSREQAFSRLVSASRDEQASRAQLARALVAFLPYATLMRRWPGAVAIAWSLLSLLNRGLSRRVYVVSVRVQSGG